MGKYYFVYGCDLTEEVETFKQLEQSKKLDFLTIEQFLDTKDATAEDRVIVYGTSSEIKAILEQSFIYGFSVALIAQKAQRYLRETFEIPKDPKLALQIALEGECKEIDLLYADGEIVLWGALVGEAPPHGVSSQSYLEDDSGGRFKALWSALKNIKRLTKVKVKILTQKGREIQTALTGIVIFEHDNHTCASNLVDEYMSVSNGKILALLVSPSSVVSYFNYLYKAIFKRTKTLPKAVGVVMSESIRIESAIPLAVQVDGKTSGVTPVTFDVHKKAVTLCASEKFWQKEAYRQSDEKEVFKLGNLPLEEEAVEYEQNHIPFFTHAQTQQYQELFVNLRQEARASSTFITLMILSTILATVGLFLNSASVIIGAMLLAPLMQPIVSFSMGLLRFDMDLFWHGLRSVAVGISLVLLLSALTALSLPFETITAEISGRLHPTLLDLIVAIVSGIAAAYAKNNPKIIGSLAGVAIAVALVPPIATAGIGLGWGNWEIFKSAFLLFLTNFAGIIFAASLTFMVLGFSPIKRAKKGMIISGILLLLICIPLYFSFSFMVKDANIKNILEDKIVYIDNIKIDLENITISHAKAKLLIVRCDLITDKHLTKKERKELKEVLSDSIKAYSDKEKLVIQTLERLED